MRSVLTILRSATRAAVVLVVVGSAQAADINVSVADGTPVITVRGELQFGDERKFIDVALARSNAIVILEGPGGNLQAGLEIGKAVRLKGFITAVGNNSMCASACALAWVGGQKRFMGQTARVGFHAAYRTVPDGTPISVATGNALVGAYLNQLGLPTSAVLFIVDAPPEGMSWLTPTDARSRGIEVVTIPDQSSNQSAQRAPLSVPVPLPQASAPQAPQQSASVDWTVQGEWVQAASRSTLPEAVSVADEIRGKNPNTAVFRYQNGWFGVVVGPFSPGRGEVARSALLAASEVPADSLVTRGDKFTALAWGSPKARVMEGSVPQATISSAEQAMSFAQRFQIAWSSDNGSALAFLNRFYDDELLYFGKMVPKTAVLLEKRKFADRWTIRRYTTRPASLEATCSPDQADCTVTGIIDWDATAPERQVRSIGSAKFELRVRYRGGSPTIVGESSTVLQRETSRTQPVTP